MPSACFGTQPAVYALMVKVNRRLYLQQALGRKRPGFEQAARRVRSALSMLLLRAEPVDADRSV